GGLRPDAGAAPGRLFHRRAGSDHPRLPPSFPGHGRRRTGRPGPAHPLRADPVTGGRRPLTKSARPAATGGADLLAEGRAPRFVLILLGIWLNAADTLVAATIMPSVGRDLGGHAWFGWATAGFLLGAIVAGASAGRMSELLGLRRATVLAGATFAAGCLLGALAPDVGTFLAGRLVQGVGAGWVAGLSMVAIALLFPQRHLARVFASAAAVWGVATLLGPLIGGLFAEAGNWRGVFWLFAGQAVLFCLAAPWLLSGAAPPRRGGR